jgi:hypothetical protein
MYQHLLQPAAKKKVLCMAKLLRTFPSHLESSYAKSKVIFWSLFATSYPKTVKKIIFRNINNQLKKLLENITFFGIVIIEAPDNFNIEKLYFLTSLHTPNTPSIYEGGH